MEEQIEEFEAGPKNNSFHVAVLCSDFIFDTLLVVN